MGMLVGGRFEVVREAGAGAMARVYEARDITSGATVAVKILRDGGEHTMRRFAREVAALVELSHPGIVRYVAHGRTTQGEAYLAMEWLDGESLDKRLERGPLAIREALAMTRSVAIALGAAHAQQIVHRDIKPANIFLVGGDPAQAKLVDFGLVRDLDATFALTSTGDLVGTPLFMAPEQASCDPSLDARVDIYSLGAVLYACLTGRAPIVAGNIVGLLAKIVLEVPQPASTFEPSVPAVVDEMLARFLAKSRDERPANGTVAASEIDAAIAGLSGARRAQPAILPAREQRVVSILLSSSAGPAAVSLDATLGALGGVLQLADGSTMVVFDGPETPGDLASRAARFALGLRRSSLAVSIATGRAVLSGPTPMGEVIDRAADQLGRATGLIRIDDNTAGLLEGRFELAADGSGTSLIRERSGELDAVRTLLGKPTRCVGRDRELAAIEGFFAEVAAESTARAVIVLADPGVGKSRLTHELLRRLASHSEAPEVIVTRCESITERSPFAAAIGAVRKGASIDGAARREVQVEKLSSRLARDGITDPAVGEFLAEMLGIGVAASERVEAARENPSLMFERIRTAWVGWLASLCATRPVLLVIEDLHWADESSLLLVDAALTALDESRFMVLALARPEVKARRPWSAHKPQEIRLDPLSRRASERLIRDALEDVTDDVVRDIMDRAQGNPLFLEELVRASQDAEGTELPVGIIGTLQRRFDALQPDARSVLRAASIFGERFTASGIVPLVASNLSVPAMLDELVSAELVQVQAGGHAFRHALVRDAAYALLAEADRALGHALVARRLADETAPDPAVVAWHFEHGGEPAAAAVWYARAAEHALVHNDLAGALRHAERAQRWTEDLVALGTLDLILAEVEMVRGHLEQARIAAERATTRVPQASAQWFEAAGLIITASGQVGANDLVEQWLTRAMTIEPEPAAASACVLCLSRGSSQLAWDERNPVARQALARADRFAGADISPSAWGRLEYARAFIHMYDGRVDLSVQGLQGIAARHARNGAARDALQMTLIALILGAYGGNVEHAHAGMVQCVAEAEKIDARYLADWSRWGSALPLFMLGEYQRAETALEPVAAMLERQPLFNEVTTLFRSWACFASDDVDGLARLLASSSAAPRYARFKAVRAGYAAWLRFRQGDLEGGCADARDALARLASVPGLYTDACLSGFSPALATLVRARTHDAGAALSAHVARLDGLTEALGTPEAREVFRTRVPWNAHVLGMSQQFS